MLHPTDEAHSVVELAETIKELVRIIRCIEMEPRGITPTLEARLEAVYKKASMAKDRMDT